MNDFIKKNGLIYSEDLKTLVGIDFENNTFMGRVPFGVHYIEDEVFAGCNYQSVSLPDSVERIGNSLFENSKNLQRVKLPAMITELPPYLFAGCSSLNKITMPNQLNGFSEGLFYGCSSLEEIPFRLGITELPENVFAGCSAIKSIVLPNSITKICSGAFANCTSLESIVLPENLISIADDAFAGCEKIRTIRISDSNNLFFVDDETGNLYEKTVDGSKCIFQITKEQSQEIRMFDNDINPNELMLLDEDEDDDYNVDLGAAEDELASVIIDVPESTQEESESQEEVTESKEQTLEEKLAEIMQAEKRSYAHNELSIEELQQIFTKKYEPEPEIAPEVENEIVVPEENETSEVETMIETPAETPVETQIETQEENKTFVAETEAEIPQDFVVQPKLEHNEDVALYEDSEQSEIQDEVQNRQEISEIAQIDSKTQLLLDSVEFSQIANFVPKDQVPSDRELFVIAEKLVSDANGNKNFSQKLQHYCKQVAAVQDFTRIYLLYGIPVENDEFMQFYHHFISRRNVILACDAPSPSKLSDFCKLVCEESNISLDREDLLQQRKQIATKNDLLIKLVIQDKYE
ncbi:MAG: leucine-rich repeat protein [Treponema sp.]|nr:leucine-rich repeat protein [Treponema sp.]